jgi:nitroreductase
MKRQNTGAARRAALCALACIAGLAASAEGAGSNATLLLLSASRTTKGFDADKAVSEAQIKQILAAGVNAPSAQNKQPWYFSAVIGAKALDELRSVAKSAMLKGGPGKLGGTGAQGGPGGQGDQPPGPPEGAPVGDKGGAGPQGQPPKNAPGGSPGGRAGGPGAMDPLDKATAVILVSGLKEWSWVTTDCAIACEAMSVAAQSLGLGTHIVLTSVDALKSTEATALRKKLGIPANMEPQIMILLGYPAGAADAVSKASTRNAGNYSILK